MTQDRKPTRTEIARISRFLRGETQIIKSELAQMGITPRQFGQIKGDTAYAADELLEAMQDTGISWDDSAHKAIVTSPLFVRAARWLAAYNAIGGAPRFLTSSHPD